LKDETKTSSFLNLVGIKTLPIFLTFFVWGIGSGAQTLARPLFAYSLGGSVFLVGLLLSFNALSSGVAGPVTGFVTDRWGRKPLLIAGSFIRSAVAALEFFCTSYEQFFVLEFIGGIGVSMWMTSSNILIADLSDPSNRGRAVALRGTSMRLGTILGPLSGGLLAAVFGLRAMFLVNSISKAIVCVATLFLIAESRPEPKTTEGSKDNSKTTKLDLSFFASRAFLVLAFTTFGVSMMGGGVFHILFPLYSQKEILLSIADVGFLISASGVVTLLVSFPNGMFVDRFGRKKSLVPGLLLLVVSVLMLNSSDSYGDIFLMAMVYGVAAAMCMGATQTYAMDLAPEDRRGAFLGIWSLFTHTGGMFAALMSGIVVDSMGFSAAFLGVGGWLAVATVLLILFGPETGPRQANRSTQPAATSTPSPGESLENPKPG
jgi:MFS family permease